MYRARAPAGMDTRAYAIPRVLYARVKSSPGDAMRARRAGQMPPPRPAWLLLQLLLQLPSLLLRHTAALDNGAARLPPLGAKVHSSCTAKMHSALPLWGLNLLLSVL